VRFSPLTNRKARVLLFKVATKIIARICMGAVRFIERVGGSVLSSVEGFGSAVQFFLLSLRGIIRPPFRLHSYLVQLLQIGFHSTLVISLIGMFTGAVLAVQMEYTLSKFGATAFTGSAIALSLIRELGPVLTALMVVGRAGSAITAEIGIMRITEQIDALRGMAVDPLQYLMAPRLVAGLIAMPLLMAIFVVVGIAGGYVVSVGLLGLSSGTFMNEMISAVDSVDVVSGFVKAIVFGLIFGWVSCYKGYTCGFGAVGVNKATTQSVVTASVAVLVVDYFLTSMLTQYFD
jgi:phospholipid/cholesterol/gamma-HCH transport system permease protein